MQNYHSPYTGSYLRHGAAGLDYDKRLSNTFELSIFDLEKTILRHIYESLLGSRSQNTYLDYACGTGRILALFSNRIKAKVGIDTSPAQVEHAKRKLPDTEFLIGNIVTNPECLGKRRFTFITCFRLFLNLEKANRVPTLKQLHKHLEDDGYLVIDNHMNRYSVLGMMALLARHVLRYPPKSLAPARTRGIIGTMSEREVRAALAEAGFRVKEVFRFFLLPGHKSFVLLPRAILVPTEEFLSTIPFLNLFSKNQIFLCDKKATVR